MLSKPTIPIKETENSYTLAQGLWLYAKTLQGQNQAGSTALFIHGGGSGGNHTIVDRPARWLIQEGLFHEIILPDRRGAARSAPLDKLMTYEDNAKDLKELLDAMRIQNKITAIGISYGGPIALTLAALDPRIEEVILVASSPSLKPATGLVGFLYRKKLLDKIVAKVYKRLVGKKDAQYPSFDAAYDAKNVGDLKKIFAEAIMKTPKERFDSLLYENASTCDLNNQAISGSIILHTPIYRVIGTKDETWEVDLKDSYQGRLTQIKTSYIEGASHKDVFFRAEEFYQALKTLYTKNKKGQTQAS
ncbi:MAG: alpha/beta hydrolase [Clostridia bacterium]|nr:alpha/beta hydrolase [Clostridia bacterium]